MEKISWTDHLRNEVLYSVKVKRNTLQSIKRIKANWMGHILYWKCLLKHIELKIEGRIEVKERRGRRHKQPLDYFKETRGYWYVKEAALDSIRWRTRFGKGYEPNLLDKLFVVEF